MHLKYKRPNKTALRLKALIPKKRLSNILKWRSRTTRCELQKSRTSKGTESFTWFGTAMRWTTEAKQPRTIGTMPVGCWANWCWRSKGKIWKNWFVYHKDLGDDIKMHACNCFWWRSSSLVPLVGSPWPSELVGVLHLDTGRQSLCIGKPTLNQLSNNFCITVSNILIFNLNHIIYKRMMPMLAAS